MAFRKAAKWTAIGGGGAVAAVLGLWQLSEYRKTQVSCRRDGALVDDPEEWDPPCQIGCLVRNVKRFGKY